MLPPPTINNRLQLLRFLGHNMHSLAAGNQLLLEFILKLRVLPYQILQKLRCSWIGGVGLSGGDIAPGGTSIIGLAGERHPQVFCRH